MNKTQQHEIDRVNTLTDEQFTKDKKMEFMKVLNNNDKQKTAIFFLPENGKFYLYSYVNNEVAHETMVFECDEDGKSNMSDLASGAGYVPSSEIMSQLR